MIDIDVHLQDARRCMTRAEPSLPEAAIHVEAALELLARWVK